MTVKKVNSMGTELDSWIHKSCDAMIGTGNNWATIYMINSSEQGKGHATELLTEMKAHYEAKGKKFGSSVALNGRMRHLLQKLKIVEYS